MIFESDTINEAPTPQDQNKAYGITLLNQAKETRFGSGTAVVRNNYQGWWAGSDAFESAPLGTDYNGNFFAHSASITGNITATGGSITGSFDITTTG